MSATAAAQIRFSPSIRARRSARRAVVITSVPAGVSASSVRRTGIVPSPDVMPSGVWQITFSMQRPVIVTLPSAAVASSTVTAPDASSTLSAPPSPIEARGRLPPAP